MPLGLQAIVPKKHAFPDPSQVATLVPKALMSYGFAVTRRMAAYPAQMPPKNPKRKPYRRTGDYGRYWSAPGAVRVTGYTLTVVNRVVHKGVSYGVYVGGPIPGQGAGFRQAAEMRRRGWPSISTVAREEGRTHRPVLNRAILGRP
jgi:hypothetical protein